MGMDRKLRRQREKRREKLKHFALLDNDLSVVKRGTFGAQSGSGRFIVKVQTALDNPLYGPALVYNHDQSRMTQESAEPGTQVHTKMGGRPKAFFFATVENGELVLGEEAPCQDW